MVSLYFQGASKETVTLISPAMYSPVVWSYFANNITVSGFTFSHDFDTQNALLLYYSNNIAIRDNAFTSSINSSGNHTALNIMYGSFITAANNRFYKYNLPIFHQVADDVTIANNTIVDPQGYGINSVSSQRTKIFGNTIINTTTSGGKGMSLYNFPRNSVVQSNTISGFSDGILMYNGGSATIISNVVVGNTSDISIWSTYGAVSPLITFNIFDTINGSGATGSFNVGSDGLPKTF